MDVELAFPATPLACFPFSSATHDFDLTGASVPKEILKKREIPEKSTDNIWKIGENLKENMEIETVGQLQVYLLLKKADLLEYYNKCEFF